MRENVKCEARLRKAQLVITLTSLFSTVRSWLSLSYLVSNLNFDLESFDLCRTRSQQQAQQLGMSLRKSLDVASDEVRQLERTRQSLVEQLDGMSGELQRLQIANSELQKQRDMLEDEKEDVIRDLDRQLKENERW